ncbi:transcription factor GTE7-like [Apium graveolens]|uniref:transcription factor GTE7-like n=1 Tax=Apium graveolens TaxID=4045 RepID=UPI003D7B090B
MTSPVSPSKLKAPCMNNNTNIKTLNPKLNETPQSFVHGPDVQQISDHVEAFRQSYLDDLVDFDVNACSETEFNELKDKFFSNVERIRGLVKKIEARQPELDKIEDVELRKRGNSAKKSSSKKTKITGQKRAMQITPDRESKRSKTMELNLTDTRKADATMMRKCGAILDKLMKHKHGWVFNKPVDVVALKIPDYNQIVKCPMDLGTVKLKLDKGGYGTPLDFAKDVRLTFDNAMLYNFKGDPVHTMAAVFLEMFDTLFVPAFGKALAELTEDDTEEALSDEAPLVEALDAKKCERAAKKSVSKKQRTMKEVKENPRLRGSMSDLERDQLGQVLEELAEDEEYLNEILQIVGKRNPKMTIPDEDAEVELDFEALDNETMWDLHRFVRLNSKGRRE